MNFARNSGNPWQRAGPRRRACFSIFGDAGTMGLRCSLVFSRSEAPGRQRCESRARDAQTAPVTRPTSVSEFLRQRKCGTLSLIAARVSTVKVSRHAPEYDRLRKVFAYACRGWRNMTPPRAQRRAASSSRCSPAPASTESLLFNYEVARP